jgi:hypothetical protein
MKTTTRLTLTASALELGSAGVGFAYGGFTGMIAALIGASIASAAQIAAVAMLRPAMGAPAGTFQQRWVLGMAVRFASFIALAVLMVLMKDTLPPLWLATGYLFTMLVLLFAETRFLK